MGDVEAEADGNYIMKTGSMPAGWRHARFLYRLTLPSSGWWIDIEHGDTLSTLWRELAPTLLPTGRREPLTRAHVLSDDRCLALAIAEYCRGLVLHDGSQPLGVTWGSKLGYGSNYALWLRKNDDGATPAEDGVAADAGSTISLRDEDFARHSAARHPRPLTRQL